MHAKFIELSPDFFIIPQPTRVLCLKRVVFAVPEATFLQSNPQLFREKALANPALRLYRRG